MCSGLYLLLLIVLPFYTDRSPVQRFQIGYRCGVGLWFLFWLLTVGQLVLTFFNHSYFPITIRLLSSWWFFSLSVLTLPVLRFHAGNFAVIVTEHDVCLDVVRTDVFLSLGALSVLDGATIV